MGAIGVSRTLALGQPVPAIARGFDFTREVMPHGVAVSRTSPAWALDHSGRLIEHDPDHPRFEHRLTGGQWTTAGLLIEPPATNLFRWSETLAAATGTNVVIDTDDTVGPSGMPAARLTVPADGVALCNQALAVPGSAMTFSLLVKGSGAGGASFGVYNATGGSDLVFISIDYASGALSYSIGNAGGSIRRLADGWMQIAVSISTGFDPGDWLAFYLGWIGGGAAAGERIHVAGVQVEAGPYATSRISTAGAVATRAGDVLTLDWGSRGVADGEQAIRWTLAGGGVVDSTMSVIGGIGTTELSGFPEPVLHARAL